MAAKRETPEEVRKRLRNLEFKGEIEAGKAAIQMEQVYQLARIAEAQEMLASRAARLEAEWGAEEKMRAAKASSERRKGGNE